MGKLFSTKMIFTPTKHTLRRRSRIRNKYMIILLFVDIVNRKENRILFFVFTFNRKKKKVTLTCSPQKKKNPSKVKDLLGKIDKLNTGRKRTNVLKPPSSCFFVHDSTTTRVTSDVFS